MLDFGRRKPGSGYGQSSSGGGVRNRLKRNRKQPEQYRVPESSCSPLLMSGSFTGRPLPPEIVSIIQSSVTDESAAGPDYQVLSQMLLSAGFVAEANTLSLIAAQEGNHKVILKSILENNS